MTLLQIFCKIILNLKFDNMSKVSSMTDTFSEELSSIAGLNFQY